MAKKKEIRGEVEPAKYISGLIYTSEVSSSTDTDTGKQHWRPPQEHWQDISKPPSRKKTGNRKVESNPFVDWLQRSWSRCR
jgi:hypothetical protein